MPNPCPKCQHDNPPGTEACRACGLIFANFDPGAAERLRADRATRQADSVRARNLLLSIGALLLAALAAAAWWSSRPDPHAFAPPSGQARAAFSGQALDYAGPGAELRMAHANGTEVAVGRIEADGRFRFELPAAPPPVPPPAWLSSSPPAGDPSTWTAGQRRFEEIRRTPEFRAQNAMRGLGAGDGWRHLAISPDDLVASRFGVIYVGPAERGDLIASNSDHRGLAVGGDHMLVLIHASRAGRVDGVAQRVNVFGVEVGNPWTLDLRAGWNLAICRQKDNLMTLEYVTGELPDDLRWRTIDPRTLQTR